MIKIFYGNDRQAARQAMLKLFGTKDYEIIDPTDLTPEDLPSIFLGNSLFTDQRKILIRDFFANKDIAELLPDYATTPHIVVLIESQFSPKSNLGKTLQKQQVEIREFKLPDPDRYLSFNIYRTAKHDGQKAIQLLQRLQSNTDSRFFFGSLAFQALKDYATHPGAKEKRVLRELSSLDQALRATSSTGFDPWLLLQAFLLRLSSL